MLMQHEIADINLLLHASMRRVQVLSQRKYMMRKYRIMVRKRMRRISRQVPISPSLQRPFLRNYLKRIEVHPISVYWLLKEGIEKEGWRCLPEENVLLKISLQ